MFGKKKLVQEIKFLNERIKCLEKCLKIKDEIKISQDIYTDEIEAERNKVDVVVDQANIFLLSVLNLA